jgi:omega-6 fatty acid desaturase (delta-12 desaturase)
VGEGPETVTVEARLPAWKTTLDRYARADDARSARQVVLTCVLYALCLAACWASLRVGYWLTLLCSVPAALMQVRLFTLFHECTHRSLFSRPRRNEAVGTVLGVLCYSSFQQWGRRHALHHATSGDLDRRGWWEIPTLTVGEYRMSSRRDRLSYRVVRTPALLFTLVATGFFLAVERLQAPGARRRERIDVWGTTAAIAGLIAAAIALAGPAAFLAVWLPVSVLAAAGGFWLFYVQHQFEQAYWTSGREWSFYDAAMRGSSFVRLPRLLEWATLCIGYHHIHHLHPRIPNYRLAAAHWENPEFHDAVTFTLRQTLPALRAQVWDGKALVRLSSHAHGR